MHANGVTLIKYSNKFLTQQNVIPFIFCNDFSILSHMHSIILLIIFMIPSFIKYKNFMTSSMHLIGQN